MWIFLNDAFLSIVAHRARPGHLLVRARSGEDIGRVFPDAKVDCTPSADYRYRTTLPARNVAHAIAQQLLTIDYDNFKNSVQEHHRHGAYFQVWHAMNNWQRRNDPTAPRTADLFDDGPLYWEDGDSGPMLSNCPGCGCLYDPEAESDDQTTGDDYCADCRAQINA